MKELGEVPSLDEGSKYAPGSDVKFTSVNDTRQLKENWEPAFDPDFIGLWNATILATVFFEHLQQDNGLLVNFLQSPAISVLICSTKHNSLFKRVLSRVTPAVFHQGRERVCGVKFLA